jgi:hypothetical protein
MGEKPLAYRQRILSDYTFQLSLKTQQMSLLDKEKNQCVRERTGTENIVKEIKQYQEKWLQHIQRMDTNVLTKQALQYKPKG